MERDAAKPVRLNLGCGPKLMDGFVNVDLGGNWSGINPDVEADISKPLPFPDNHADEIHAYEVLEHCGTQGDYKFFFAQWSDFWRVLKPAGVFFGTVPLPTSVWAWGDPSHTRVIPKESFVFLSQPQYSQVGKTAMSDFRSIYKADFDIIHLHENGDVLEFALQTVKPSRIA